MGMIDDWLQILHHLQSVQLYLEILHTVECSINPIKPLLCDDVTETAFLNITERVKTV